MLDMLRDYEYEIFFVIHEKEEPVILETDNFLLNRVDFHIRAKSKIHESVTRLMSFGLTDDASKLDDLTKIWGECISDPLDISAFYGVRITGWCGENLTAEQVMEEGLANSVDIYIDAYLNKNIPIDDIFCGRERRLR